MRAWFERFDQREQLSLLLLALVSRFLRDAIGVNLGAVLRDTGKNVVVAALSAVGPAIVHFGLAIGPDNVWLAFGLSAAGAAAGWLVGIAVTAHPIGADLWRALRHR